LIEITEKTLHYRVIQEYKQSEVAKNIHDRFERLIGLHAAVWRDYDERLFELFDFRRPVLWAQYVYFVKEYYKINDAYPLRISRVTSFDKIC